MGILPEALMAKRHPCVCIPWQEQLSRQGDESMLQKALEESKREMDAKGGVWNIGVWNMSMGVMNYNHILGNFHCFFSETEQFIKISDLE